MDPRIDALQRAAAGRRDVVGLAGGLPSPAQFPRRALLAAFGRAIGDRAAPALQYGWPEGIEGLRGHIAARLRARGADVRAEDVIVTHGAQQAVALASRLLCEDGDAVAVDAASYPAVLDLFRTRGLRLVDDAAGARLAYRMPAVGNPSGRAADADERAAWLASGVPIIEDDAYAELRFDGTLPRPLIADAPDRVFHVGTFSKTLSPGLRVGWLVPPRAHRERLIALKQGHDLQATSLGQAIVEDVLRQGGYDDRLTRLRGFYHRRARRLATAVSRHLPKWRLRFPEGGFSLWVEADRPADEVELLERAVAAGVSFDPGSMFRAGPSDGVLRLRLCYSWAPARDLAEGARRLATAWAQTP